MGSPPHLPPHPFLAPLADEAAFFGGDDEVVLAEEGLQPAEHDGQAGEAVGAGEVAGFEGADEGDEEAVAQAVHAVADEQAGAQGAGFGAEGAVVAYLEACVNQYIPAVVAGEELVGRIPAYGGAQAADLLKAFPSVGFEGAFDVIGIGEVFIDPFAVFFYGYGASGDAEAGGLGKVSGDALEVFGGEFQVGVQFDEEVVRRVDLRIAFGKGSDHFGAYGPLFFCRTAVQLEPGVTFGESQNHFCRAIGGAVIYDQGLLWQEALLCQRF